MLVIDPKNYRIDANHPMSHNVITPSNVDDLLDAGAIQVAMTNGRWWTLRRNGMTKHWKRQPNRFRIPVKAGLRACGAITERDFIEGKVQ